MSEHAAQHAIGTPPIPRPRTAGTENAAEHEEAGTVGAQPEPASAEPWRSARTRTQYWDVTSGNWRSRVPSPRPGDSPRE